MPRNRMIKPEFWESFTLSRITMESNLLFIGLWNFCDDYGVILLSPRRILGEVFPNRDEVTVANIQKWLGELITVGLATPFQNEGKYWLKMTSWEEHQKIQHASKRRNPAYTDESPVTDKELSKLGIKVNGKTLAEKREEAKAKRAEKAVADPFESGIVLDREARAFNHILDGDMDRWRAIGWNDAQINSKLIDAVDWLLDPDKNRSKRTGSRSFLNNWMKPKEWSHPDTYIPHSPVDGVQEQVAQVSEGQRENNRNIMATFLEED